MCIYIYIEREREIMYMYVYIYIYMFVEVPMAALPSTTVGASPQTRPATSNM